MLVLMRLLLHRYTHLQCPLVVASRKQPPKSSHLLVGKWQICDPINHLKFDQNMHTKKTYIYIYFCLFCLFLKLIFPLFLLNPTSFMQLCTPTAAPTSVKALFSCIERPTSLFHTPIRNGESKNSFLQWFFEKCAESVFFFYC